MTRQRQILITVTYNDLGCIIDTKAEPYEEPNLQPTCNQLATSCISRQAAIDVVDSETVSTNPEHFKSSEKFIKFMDDADIASFGKWQWANGFNTALTATSIQLKKLPSAQPEQRWIPVTERLPEANGRYLVTRGLNACGALWNRVYIINYSDLMGLKSERIWWVGNVGKSDFERIDDVLAWQALPEPYAERRTDD